MFLNKTKYLSFIPQHKSCIRDHFHTEVHCQVLGGNGGKADFSKRIELAHFQRHMVPSVVVLGTI